MKVRKPRWDRNVYNSRLNWHCRYLYMHPSVRFLDFAFLDYISR